MHRRQPTATPANASPSRRVRTSPNQRRVRTSANPNRPRVRANPNRRASPTQHRVRANPNQLSFAWGGAREGAGRPARGPIVSERHRTRPNLAPQFPVHVIARVAPSVRTMGRRDAYATIRRAVKLSLARANFRIVRLAIHAQRLELLVEADDKQSLARGMQGFQVSAARAVNRALRRTGSVFPDRYRMTILRTRETARAAVRSALRAAVHADAPVSAQSAIATALDPVLQSRHSLDTT